MILPKIIAKKDVPSDTRLRGLSGWQKNKAFWVLAAVGIIDSATRTAFLTFFPFLLQTKGAGIRITGLAYTLVFAGGVAGKFFCGVLAAEIGALRTIVATEIVMAALIVSTVVLPLKGALLLAPVIGTFLNGTSSVLYGSVPQILTGDQEQQGFAAFYTAAIGAGALSPFFYGMMSGYTGVPGIIWVITAISAFAVPFVFYLRPYLD